MLFFTKLYLLHAMHYTQFIIPKVIRDSIIVSLFKSYWLSDFIINKMEKEKKTGLMKRTALVSFIVLLFILFAFLFVKVFSILLLLFGGLLFSVFFHAISDKIRKWTGWHKGITLILAILLVFGFIAGVSYLVGHRISQQYEEFAETIPKTIDNFKNQIEGTSWGDTILDNLPSMDEGGEKVINNAGSFFKSTFGFLGDIYALVFLGVFIMISPAEYKRGIISLMPRDHQEQTEEILDKIGDDLKTWLKAQLLEMLFVFTLTAVGLLILGINLWLILAIIAGTLTFIPNIGPTLALIPAALVGLLEGLDMALIIIGLFLLVQTLESGVFGPFVRKKMLSLPPALVLFFQLMIGAISGAWGILFATPILVMVVILVNEIYVKTMLEQKIIEEEEFKKGEHREDS